MIKTITEVGKFFTLGFLVVHVDSLQLNFGRTTSEFSLVINSVFI